MNEPFIREIAQLIQQQGFGVVGTSIFINDFPQETTEGLMLVTAPSIAPEKYIDTEYPTIDFWYISAHTDKAQRRLRDIYNNLHRREHYQTQNWYIYLSTALGTIEGDIDRTQEGSKLLRLSVQFIVRNLNNVS